MIRLKRTLLGKQVNLDLIYMKAKERASFGFTSVTCIHRSGSSRSKEFEIIYNTCNCKDRLSVKFLKD